MGNRRKKSITASAQIESIVGFASSIYHWCCFPNEAKYTQLCNIVDESRGISKIGGAILFGFVSPVFLGEQGFVCYLQCFEASIFLLHLVSRHFGLWTLHLHDMSILWIVEMHFERPGGSRQLAAATTTKTCSFCARPSLLPSIFLSSPLLSSPLLSSPLLSFPLLSSLVCFALSFNLSFLPCYLVPCFLAFFTSLPIYIYIYI